MLGCEKMQPNAAYMLLCNFNVMQQKYLPYIIPELRLQAQLRQMQKGRMP